jgi:sulfite reductase (NADPH) flavoprotein alpha-component
MAPDVHASLLEVISHHGGRSAEEAAAYLSTMMSERRYVRDVY